MQSTEKTGIKVWPNMYTIQDELGARIKLVIIDFSKTMTLVKQRE